MINQTYLDWELIIVDNNSNDNTFEVLNELVDSRIKIIRVFNGGIIAIGRNAGISIARGKWIAFLDSDDWWEKNKLEVCFNNISNRVDCIYHDVKIVRQHVDNGVSKLIKSRSLAIPVFQDLIVNGNPIVTSSVVVRADVIKLVAGMSEERRMIGGEDYHTWLKISQTTEGFKCIPIALGYYYVHELNVSKRNPAGIYGAVIRSFYPILSCRLKRISKATYRYYCVRYEGKKRSWWLKQNLLVYSTLHGNKAIRLRAFIYMFLLIRCKF